MENDNDLSKDVFFYPFNCDEALDDVMYLEDTLDDNFLYRSVQYQQNLFFGFKVQIQIFVVLILILPFIWMKKLLRPWTLTKLENQMELWKMVATLIHHVMMNFLPFQFFYIMM